MNKNLIIGLAIGLAIITGGYYYFTINSDNSTVSKPQIKTVAVKEKNNNKQTDNLDKEIEELDYLIDENQNDLNEITDEVDNNEITKDTDEIINTSTAVDTSDINNLENELSTEINGFSNDLTDLDDFSNDNSLDNLGNDLDSF